MRPAPGTPLCPLDALDDPGAKGFSFGKGQTRFDIFLVRKSGEVRAYLNECPHAHARLDNWPDKFLTLDETRIICGVHAALFEIESGLCTSGPCTGRRLTPVAIKIVNGLICLATKGDDHGARDADNDRPVG